MQVNSREHDTVQAGLKLTPKAPNQIHHLWIMTMRIDADMNEANNDHHDDDDDVEEKWTW